MASRLGSTWLNRVKQVAAPTHAGRFSKYALYAEKYFVRVPLPTVRSMQNILDDYAAVNPRAREVDAARLVDASYVQDLQREGFFRSLGWE